MRIEMLFTFEAAHRLERLPKAHKCYNLHGHNYGVKVVVDGPVHADLGWVQDYAVIQAAFDEIVMPQLDHKYLNDVIPEHTTAENIAKWIYESLAVALPWLHSIEVKETPTTNVIYGPIK